MKTLLALTLAVLCAGAALAQSRTPRVGLDYTGSESENRNWNKVDRALPYGPVASSSLLFCGQNVNTSTDYIGPAVSAFFNRTNPLMGDATCDALDSTTETTADNPINSAFPPFRVVAMYCSVSSDPASDVVFTARTAAADLSPSLTCTVAGTGSGQDCFAYAAGAAPQVAAGGAVAVKVVTLEDLSAQDASCRWIIQY